MEKNNGGKWVKISNVFIFKYVVVFFFLANRNLNKFTKHFVGYLPRASVSLWYVAVR